MRGRYFHYYYLLHCFLGVGTITGDFTNMPLNVAITITVIVALIMNRKETFANKVEVFTKEQVIPISF